MQLSCLIWRPKHMEEHGQVAQEVLLQPIHRRSCQRHCGQLLRQCLRLIWGCIAYFFRMLHLWRTERRGGGVVCFVLHLEDSNFCYRLADVLATVRSFQNSRSSRLGCRCSQRVMTTGNIWCKARFFSSPDSGSSRRGAWAMKERELWQRLVHCSFAK